MPPPRPPRRSCRVRAAPSEGEPDRGGGFLPPRGGGFSASVGFFMGGRRPPHGGGWTASAACEPRDRGPSHWTGRGPAGGDLRGADGGFPWVRSSAGSPPFLSGGRFLCWGGLRGTVDGPPLVGPPGCRGPLGGFGWGSFPAGGNEPGRRTPGPSARLPDAWTAWPSLPSLASPLASGTRLGCRCDG